MPEMFDYTEVPYMQEILNFLPIDPAGDEDVIDYIQNIITLIIVNYKYGQYQFAYFGVHLLYMTYIYCTAWKIAQIEPDRYKDAIVFARSYNGRESDFKIEDAESIFSYSLVPEKEIARLFKIIELDKSQISMVGSIVAARDEMAHATGKLVILTEDILDAKLNSVLMSMKSIHKCMDKPIRKWYEQILLDFCAGNYEGYDDPADFISERMIPSFKLSINELLICNEMSVSKLINAHRDYEFRLRSFKGAVLNHCQEMGYI